MSEWYLSSELLVLADRIYYWFYILLIVLSVVFTKRILEDPKLRELPKTRTTFLMMEMAFLFFLSVLLWDEGISRGLDEAQHPTVDRVGP